MSMQRFCAGNSIAQLRYPRTPSASGRQAKTAARLANEAEEEFEELVEADATVTQIAEAGTR